MNIVCQVNWTKEDISLSDILNTFYNKGSEITLLRFTVNPESSNAIFLLESKNSETIDSIVNEIKT